MSDRPAKTANDEQVGGDHYKGTPAGEQHWDRMWGLYREAWFVGNITKYVERYRKKDGLKDLRKARHYLDKLIELEEAASASTQDVAAAPAWHETPGPGPDVPGEPRRVAVVPGPVDGCSPGGTLPPAGRVTISRPKGRRTKAEVMTARRAPGGGCCEPWKQGLRCDCMERASGTTGCNVCHDPNCKTPNEQH